MKNYLMKIREFLWNIVKNRTKKRLSILVNLILVVVFSGIITAVCFTIQPNSTSEVLSSIRSDYRIAILNFIPVFLSVLFFYLLTNSVFYSSAIVSVVFELASIINRFKIFYRDDPFVPLDVTLGGEAMSIMSKTRMEVSYTLFVVLAVQVLFLVAAGFFIRSKKFFIPIRLAGVIACAFLAVAMNNHVYQSAKLYNELPVKGNIYNVSSNFNSKGFIYCFIYNLSAYSMEKPDGYSVKYAESLPERYKDSTVQIPQRKPHVIMILSEAFSDVTDNKNLVFNDDPIKNYKAVAAEGLSGHLIVPNFGGGTANTEYDILTGCLTQNLSKSSTSAFRLVRKNFDAFPRFLNKNGYQSLLMHPGESWFYNRQNVYKHFGVDEQIFQDQFVKPQDYKGYLVSDDAFADKLIQQFEQHVAINKNIPLFSFNASIQNHMPYTKGKYGSIPLEQINSKVELSGKAVELLSNYVTGLRDADMALGKLVAYFKQSSEPVVLVYFGDHLPNLGENYLAYRELGINPDRSNSLEGLANDYKAPFLIWANDAGKQSIQFDEAVKKLGLGTQPVISANYLSPVVYQLLGYQGVNPFYDFLNGLRKDIPVVTKNYFMTKDGFTAQLPEDLAKKISDYRIWQYYKMKSEKVR